MLAKLKSATLLGIDAMPIEVEVDASNGLPKEHISGLPDARIKESRNRIRSAIKNSHFQYPPKVYTINLAPADQHKEGTLLDLPIAVGMLRATEQIDAPNPNALYVGELALDGKIRPIQGILSICHMAKKQGLTHIYLAKDNLKEAQLIPDLHLYPLETLKDITATIDPIITQKQNIPLPKPTIETLDDVKGQQSAKRCLEIAASGHHNLLLIGPPGSGKTMLLKRLNELLPPLDYDDAIETYKIHSINPQQGKKPEFTLKAPLRSPHHSISHIGLIGGGRVPKPGEISMAHNGILLMDEFPEFHRPAIEALRQPLESQHIPITRANFSIGFPANILLAAAMNPCPCGYFNDTEESCRCHPALIQKYLKKLSGPILDRIDIVLEIPRLRKKDFHEDTPTHLLHNTLKETIQNSRNRQKNRQKQANGRLDVKAIQDHCQLDKKSQDIIGMAIEKGLLSGRAYHKVLRVARSIADLDNCPQIKFEHLSEALQYRPPRYLGK